MNTVQLTLELPRDVFSALRIDPDMFLREMRLAAAVKWYDVRYLIVGGYAVSFHAHFIFSLQMLAIWIYLF